MVFRFVLTFLLIACVAPAGSLATIYYVSSQSGSNGDDGLTPEDAFETIEHVNGLALLAGDEVRLFCGETWRADPLIVTRSGSLGSPIVYSSHPLGCPDRPNLSGAQPISGWVHDNGNVYRADLSTGANSGLFPNGLNQLFRGSDRLPFGRWPDLEGHPDGGYSTIDSQPSANQITDSSLPAGNWTGARAHVKGIRWRITNRSVDGDTGSTLTLNQDPSCWGGCSGWGYWLSNQLATLSREGEWYYDGSLNRVYLYSTMGLPTDGEIEGSAIVSGDGTHLGGVILGRNLEEHITHVTVENLRIERWFDAGITTPINLEADENREMVLQDNVIADVDGTGIRLATWVWDAAANGNGPNGWRGGRNHIIRRNEIRGANHIGVDTYGTSSTLEENVIEDIGLIENLNLSGMGCALDHVGQCTEDGAGIRLKLDGGSVAWTAHDLVVRRNRLDRIGMNGIDSFGETITLEENVIVGACFSKGDCGAIRTFGNDDLMATHVHDVAIHRNVIRETLGNTDGCHPDFDPLFGFGIYIDQYSRDVDVTENTVVHSTAAGILFQNSTGTIEGNTLYDNADEGQWGAQVRLVDGGGSTTEVAQNGNVLFSQEPTRRALQIGERSHLSASDGNYFFNPWEDLLIHDQSTGGVALTLAEWQAWSGQDATSTSHWYQLDAGEAPRSEIFVNDTDSMVAVDLGGQSYLDLDQVPVSGSLDLGPYSSRVLVIDLGSIFIDGFESGDLDAWSSSVPP